MPFFAILHFPIQATFPVTVDRLFTEMWHNFADSASWNPTVERVEIVQHIGNDLQIVYTVSNSILVSSRLGYKKIYHCFFFADIYVHIVSHKLAYKALYKIWNNFA